MEGEGRSPTATAAGGPIGPPKKTPKDFIFGKLIGEGSFSSVYLAKEVKTGEEFAIKVCSKQHIIKERKAELIKREKNVMAILSAKRSPSAPFFVRLYATFHDVERLYFVMTYAPGGELLKHLLKVGSFSIPCCRFYTGELLLGLSHLHKLRIVHRDLKPENILLDRLGHILITDFGSSKLLEENDAVAPGETKEGGNDDTNAQRGIRSNSFVGSAPYVSPEVLQGKYSIVGPPADLWAFACILYQFVSGLPPFHAQTEYLIFKKITKLEYRFPAGFDVEAKDLVEKLLKSEHLERLGACDKELYTSIQSHPFYKDVSWESLHSQEAPLISASSSVLTHQIPDSLEPGFNAKIMAERALQDDDDFPNMSWSTTAGGDKSQETEIDSDFEDEEESISLERLLDKAPQTSPESSGNKKSGSKSEDIAKHLMSYRSRNTIPASDSEREERKADQVKNNPWNAVVQGNLILKQGIISKRKGLFSRRRMLLLTEGPHLYYCEPHKMTLKGEIPWSPALYAEPKDFRIFFVHTPNRTYTLEDPEGYALEWCKAITEVRHHTYGELPKPKSYLLPGS